MESIQIFYERMMKRVDTEENRQRLKEMDIEIPKQEWVERIPERFRNVFKTKKINMDRISKVAIKYVECKAWEKGAWLVLCGERSGMGKSFDCAYVLSKFIESTGRGFIWDMPETILAEIFENIYMMDAYKKQSMLIIDDFDKCATGNGDDNSWKRNKMHELIDYRMDVRILPTLITTNVDRKRLEEIYTPYICRRIWEASENFREIK